MTASLTLLPTAAAADPALARSPATLRVLVALPSLDWEPVNVSALAAALSLSRSTVHRAIRTLRDHHYLLRRLALPGETTNGARHLYRVNTLRPDTERRATA